MIQTTPEGNRLLYKLTPVEVIFQMAALGVFWFRCSAHLPEQVLLAFVAGVAVANLLRILAVTFARLFCETSAEGHSSTAAFAILASFFLTGLAWGGGLVWITWNFPEAGLNEPLMALITAGLVMASLAGSALSPGIFLSFNLPTVAVPLFFLIQKDMQEQVAIWGFLMLLVILLSWVMKRAEAAFTRYRQAGKQNTELLKQLATAKEQATSDHLAVEKAHDSLKLEMKERTAIEAKIRASEKETARILQDMQDTYFRVDSAGKIQRISPSVKALLGISPESLTGTRLAKIFNCSRDYLQFTRALDDNCGSLQNHEVRLRDNFGQVLWASINAHLSGDMVNAHQGFEGTVRDVSESRKAAEILHLEKERLHVTLESIVDGVITTDTKGIVTYLNPVAEAMTGWNESTAAGKPLKTILKLQDETTNKNHPLPMKLWLVEGKRGQLSNPAVLIHKNEISAFTIELAGAPLKNSQGGITGSVLVFHNVTKLRTLTKQLSYQASHDALTGLINRREFDTRVSQTIDAAHKDNKDHALCYIDLDQFKIVNDTAGHHAGDELLKQVTALMQEQLRASDTLARLGGDEFGVLLIGCDIKHAQNTAEKIRSSVEKLRFIHGDHIFRIGTSIGLVIINKDTASLSELLSAADSACYVAKEQGRNLVHTYTQDDEAIAAQQGQMQWKERIQKALDNDLFTLQFQSIIPLDKKSKRGLRGEVLLRMIDDTSSDQEQIIMPTSFIPAAERYQLMPQIDQWVIRSALGSLSQKLKTEKWDRCFINLSGQSLGDTHLLKYILKQLKTYNIPGENLCFEITESAMIANIDNANRFIETLKKRGCEFALDDFGSGLSSFSYLKSLSVEYIKLDGEIVKGIDKDEAGYAMVEAINRVAHVMNMKTIAEHVESKAVYEALKRIGIDYAQGYGVDHPATFHWLPEEHNKVS